MVKPVPASPDDSPQITCRTCGHGHLRIVLQPGERALCRRCGAVLLKRARFGRDAALAFTVTGLALTLPASTLPFITVEKLRSEHIGLLSVGAHALWNDEMRLLALWVLLCGIIAPVLLLGALAALLLPPRLGRPVAGARAWWRLADAVEHWSMPEVHVLAVLVALIKLGTVVNVHIGPGFWCYAALSLATLLAWRSFQLDPDLAPQRQHQT